MTTTEVDVRDAAGTIDILPPKRPTLQSARISLAEDAEMMEDAYRIAKGVCGDGRPGTGLMVPKRFQGKPEEGAAAIIYGAELGLKALQSLQKVIPIHGMPSIEARTMVALVKARGYRIKTVAQSDESVTVWGKDLDGEEYESTWTIERAKKAGYVPEPSSPNSLLRPLVEDDWVTVTKTWDGKAKKSVLGNMKYITDPQTMLKAKAQAEVCRELAPDVLMGISYTSEDLESERWDGTISVERPSSAASAPITADEILGDEPEPAAKAKRKPRGKAEPDQEPVDAEEVADPEPAADATAPEAEPVPPQQPDPIEPDPEGGPAGDQTSDERGKLIRRLFALLGKGDVTDREDRLVIYRRALKRPEISSTNDLSDDDLRFVISGLDAQDRKGDLAMWLEGYLIAAVEEETAAAQAAAAATTTEGN